MEVNIYSKKNNKFDDYLGLVIMVVLTIIMAHNKNNLDYANYAESYYKLSNLKGAEFCYFVLQYIGRSAGLSFECFRILIYVIGMFVLWIAIHKIIKQTWIFYSLYFLFPFFLDVIEIRNYLGLTIFVYAFTILVSGGVLYKIKFVFFILVAAGFHNVYLVFLPFIFFVNEGCSNYKKIILSVATLLSIILMLFLPDLTLKFINWCYKIIKGEIVEGDRTNYLSDIHTRYGYLLILFEQIATFVISYLELQVVSRVPIEEQSIIDRKQKKFIEIVFWLNFYAFIFCPLYRIHGQFTRIMQNIMLLTHIAFVATLNVSKNHKSSQLKLIIFSYCLYVLFFFLYVIIYTHFNDIFIQIFTNKKI